MGREAYPLREAFVADKVKGRGAMSALSFFLSEDGSGLERALWRDLRVSGGEMRENDWRTLSETLDASLPR